MWLKAVTQSDCKIWIYILIISEFQIEQEKFCLPTHTHAYTHTKCWYTIRYLVRKFLSFHLLNYNVEQTRSHWTPDNLMHYINSHNPNETFSFKDTYVYINSGYTQSVWNNYLAVNNVLKTGKYLKICCAHSKTTSLLGLVSRKYVLLLQLSVYFTGYFLS
jgi:hypothetical protein